MNNKVVPSQETQKEAMNIAKATQKPGQTKEQTKLIAQGIEKGIAQYKKQHKEKARQANKAKKKAQKAKQAQHAALLQPKPETVTTIEAQSKTNMLPWALLALSWIGFIIYVTQV